MRQAACRGRAPKRDPDTGEIAPDPWFPDRGQSKAGNEGKKVCMMCPVRLECRNYQERTQNKYGIWGGVQETRGDDDDS